MPQPGKDSPAVQARRRKQQDRIVAAALDLFARHGIHRTSMQQIAAEAGMSVGSVYQYLANKEAIIEAATLAKDRSSAEALQGVRDPQALAEVLQTSVRAVATGPIERAGLNAEVTAEAARNPEVGRRLAAQFASARALLVEAQRGADPDLAEAEAELRAGLYIALMAGLGGLRAGHAPADDLVAIGLRAVSLIMPDLPATESAEDGR